MGQGSVGNEDDAVGTDWESYDGAVFGVEVSEDWLEFGEGFSEP